MTGNDIDIDFALGKFNEAMKAKLSKGRNTLHCFTWSSLSPTKYNAPIKRKTNSVKLEPIAYNNEDVMLYHTATGLSDVEEQDATYGDKRKVTETMPMRMTVFTTYQPSKAQGLIISAWPTNIDGGFKAFYTGIDISNGAEIIARDFPTNERLTAIHDKVFIFDVFYDLSVTYWMDCAEC